MSTLKQKLERLYRLAILKPEEEEDESRRNEARTSAFLLLKIARENGVKVKFEIPRSEEKKPSPPSNAPHRPSQAPWASENPFDDFMGDFFNRVQRAAKAVQDPVNYPSGDAHRSDWPPNATYRNDGPMKQAKLIPSKFFGRCKACGKSFDPGDMVWWRKDKGATHEACGSEALRDDPSTAA
jgi:hypothetical protein